MNSWVVSSDSHASGVVAYDGIVVWWDRRAWCVVDAHGSDDRAAIYQEPRQT